MQVVCEATQEAVALQAIEFGTPFAEEETNLESDPLDVQEVTPWCFVYISLTLSPLRSVFTSTTLL